VLNCLFKTSIVVLIFGLINFVGAQDVYWEPVSPIQGEQVTIYYNLEARNILPTTTNPCYIHLGYNGWTNTADYMMEREPSGLWKYEFDIPTDATIIDFVFTDLQGAWDNNGGIGIDWHINVFSEGLSVVIVNPQVENPFSNIFRTPVIIPEKFTLPISITTVTTDVPADSLFLHINDVEVTNTIDDTLKFNFDSSIFTENRYKINAIGIDVNGIRDTVEFGIVVRLEPIETIPYNHLHPGINYSDTDRHTLMLFAPEKEYVYVISDYTNWEVDNDFLMRKYEVSADSTVWWIGLPLIGGYALLSYQYLVDGEIRIADPYSELILDPWNDPYISSDTYPHLPEYPHRKTREQVGALKQYGLYYDWQYSDDFEKPKQQDLVIYELLIRDFIAEHNYQTLIDTLDYLQNLGINAIELMPFNEFEGNSSWGYNTSFHFAPDKYYGDRNDLREFIDECHRRGIAVIQDIVLNHSYGQSPLLRMYWDDENNRPAANNPWFNLQSPNSVYSFGYDFNHESEHTQYYVDRVLHYWIRYYKIDGFRLDFTKGFTQRGGEGTPYDASRIAILKRLADVVWSYDPSAYLILEHFTDNVEEKELSDYGFMLWGNSNYNYSEATMGYHSNSKSDFSWGFYKTRGWTSPNLITYMESHDEERLMYKNLTFGNSSGDYNIKDLATSLERQKLAAAFFFTLPGPKMIWQFGELGYDYSINYNGRVGEKPIPWDYLSDPKRRELYDTYAQLIKIRNRNEVFRSPATSVEISLNNPNGFKRIGLTHSSMSAIIIGNFGLKTQSINPNFFYAATWYDDINGVELIVTDTQATIELEPGEFRIFTNKHLLDIAEEKSENNIPIQFSLAQNYPNPFNPVTTINYEIPQVDDNHVKLKIYNILGNEIATLVNAVQAPGKYSIQFNTEMLPETVLPNGIYFYKLSVGDKSLIKKMLLLK